MKEWIGYIGTLGIGAFLTVLIQEIFKFRLHKRQWSDEIKKTVILKKLQVSEDAMACLQSIIDELMQLKLICQVEKDIPDNLERCQNLKDHMNTLYPEVQAKLNRLGTYYDLSPIEKRHDIYHAMESFNKHVAELSIYSQHVLISEGTTSKPIRIITGKTGNIETIMSQLIEDLNAIIDYAEDVQTVIRKDIGKYCK